MFCIELFHAAMCCVGLSELRRCCTELFHDFLARLFLRMYRSSDGKSRSAPCDGKSLFQCSGSENLRIPSESFPALSYNINVLCIMY